MTHSWFKNKIVQTDRKIKVLKEKKKWLEERFEEARNKEHKRNKIRRKKNETLSNL